MYIIVRITTAIKTIYCCRKFVDSLLILCDFFIYILHFQSFLSESQRDYYAMQSSSIVFITCVKRRSASAIKINRNFFIQMYKI